MEKVAPNSKSVGHSSEIIPQSKTEGPLSKRLADDVPKMKTLWVIDEPNQVYKFSRLFSSSRLCDSKILDTGCKVHTRISTVFLVEFFLHTYGS